MIDLTHLDWGPKDWGMSRGSQPKTKVDGAYYKVYVKDLTGQKTMEVYSEVMASRIGKVLGVTTSACNVVNARIRYGGQEWETEVLHSIDFNKKLLPSYPYYHLLSERAKYEPQVSPLEYAKEIGILEDMYKMVFFDYILCNYQRHGGNFEVLINEEGKALLAPLYDHGDSLLSVHKILIDEGLSKKRLSNLGVSNFIRFDEVVHDLKKSGKKIKLHGLQKEHKRLIFEGFSPIVSKKLMNATWKTCIERMRKIEELQVVSFD